MELRGKTTSRPPKRGRKPAKVLSSFRNFTANANADPTANAANSPLLRLPAEVSNTIYRVVLGDKVLHANDLGLLRTDETGRQITCQAQSPREVAGRIVKDSSEIGGASTWQDKHITCTSANTQHDPFSLSLLGVCRQIHSDAALIPLETNTFTFGRPSSISSLLNKMLSEQRKAVRSICIFESEVDAEGFGGLPKIDVLNKLTGLHHLTILANVPAPVSWRDGSALHRQVSNALQKATGDLKYVKWETVVVCVTVSRRATRIMQNITAFDDFRLTCREMEEALLESWDYEAELRRRQDGLKRERDERRLERKGQQERRIEYRKDRKRMWEEQEREKKLRQDVKTQKKVQKKRKKDEDISKTQARRNARIIGEEAKLNVKNAARTQRGLREVKVARYSF